MIANHKINMDLTIRSAPPGICVVQNDANSRAVELIMTENGSPWMPDSLSNVFLRFRRPDGTGGSYDTLPDDTVAWKLEENRLTVLLAPQVLAVPGFLEAQAVLLRDEHLLATFRFHIHVEGDLSEGITEAEDYINWASWARTELDQRLLEAKNSGDFDGVTYLPSVVEGGLLTWTNDKGKENPQSADLVGMLADRLGEDMFLRQSGGTMSGALNLGGNRITGLADPEAASDAVTRSYSDRLFRQVTVSLPALLWSGGQVNAQVMGVTADSLVLVCPEESTRDSYLQCGVRCTAQAENLLTFTCDVTPAATVKADVVVFLRGAAE